jgi:hypothetical protein
MFRRFLAAALAFAAANGTATAAPINLLTNGGFETGSFRGWSQGGSTGATYVCNNPNVPHTGSLLPSLGQ